MAQKIAVTGEVSEIIQDEYDHRADLGAFEELTGGIGPKSVIEAIGSSAAQHCAVEGCELRVACEDREYRDEGAPPNFVNRDPSGEPEFAQRRVSAKVSCPRSGDSEDCRATIEKATEDIETLLAEVQNGGPARNVEYGIMSPAEAEARKIKADAAAEAATRANEVLEAARSQVEPAEAEVIANFRERYGIDAPAEAPAT